MPTAGMALSADFAVIGATVRPTPAKNSAAGAHRWFWATSIETARAELLPGGLSKPESEPDTHAVSQEGMRMARWKIAYSHDNNTEVLAVEHPSAPQIEQAVEWVLDYARQHYPSQPLPEDAQEELTPAVQLAECYGITITGISRDT
jgi:hypothetical protein